MSQDRKLHILSFLVWSGQVVGRCLLLVKHVSQYYLCHGVQGGTRKRVSAEMPKKLTWAQSCELGADFSVSFYGVIAKHI